MLTDNYGSIGNHQEINWRQLFDEVPEMAPKVWNQRKDKANALIRYEGEDVSQKSTWWFLDKNNMQQCHRLLVDFFYKSRYEYLTEEESDSIKATINKAKAGASIAIEGSQEFDKIMIKTIQELNPNSIHPMFQFIGADEFPTPSQIETKHFLFWHFEN